MTTSEDRLKEARSIKLNASKEINRLTHKRLRLSNINEKTFIDDVISKYLEEEERQIKAIRYLEKVERGEEVKSFDITRLKQTPILDIAKRYGLKTINSSSRRVFVKIRNEKTPSCCLNLDKNNFTDYGSGEFGDVIDFLGKIERCEFKEACELLQSFGY